MRCEKISSLQLSYYFNIMNRIAIIGTVGVPANYGGFETLVENMIGENASSDVVYTVYCSSKSYAERLTSYKGASLKYIPLQANGSQSIVYDIWSLLRATSQSDVILILGVSGCCFLPIYRLFSKKRLVINIDGLEHRRDKWGKWTRRFLKFSEKMAVKYADVVVTDNKGIQDYVSEEYGKESALIAYGGDHVIRSINDDDCRRILQQYPVEEGKYAFSVCRIEPENNVHITLEAFKKSKKNILFVGNWSRSEYGQNLFKEYGQCENIHLINPVYDLNTLYVLRKCCAVYIHGHSAGGTNPSLVEAMFFKKPIIAFDVVYNRETTENKATYFKNVDELISCLQQEDVLLKKNADCMLEIAQRRYKWNIIAKQYEALY